MKKQLFILSAMCALFFFPPKWGGSGWSFTQNSIPNGNFEAWTPGTYEYPQNYPYTSNTEAFFRYQTPFNVTKTTDAYQGTYAVQLTTNASATDTAVAYFVNSIFTDGPNWHGGFAYNQIPTGIRGYYKYNVAFGDSALIVASFSNGGNNIGQYFFKVGGVHTTYTLFNFTFMLAGTPDSVVFAATSSDFMTNTFIPGSTLKLDSVSFTGVSSQPALMNGSFELWQSQTLYRPDNWYLQTDNGQGFNRITDAAAGNYAVEMITTQGSNKGNPVARSSGVSTGYWYCPLPPPNPCVPVGGYPFSNQIDTLIFSYKYAPSGNDSAQVYFNFKKNGSQIWGMSKNLGASASYQVVQIPFNIGQAPDTVIVQIQSSLWQDSALSYVGSDLKVDEIHFKSQPLNTGIQSQDTKHKSQIIIYPNPCKDAFTLSMENISASSAEKISLYDLLGHEVVRYQNISLPESFDVSKLAAGSYIIQVNIKDGIYRGKLNKTE